MLMLGFIRAYGWSSPFAGMTNEGLWRLKAAASASGDPLILRTPPRDVAQKQVPSIVDS